MHPLFDLRILDTIKTSEKLPLECCHCSTRFYLTVRVIKNLIQRNTKNSTNDGRFCGRTCQHLEQTKKVKVNCGQCSNEFTLKRSLAEYRKKKGKTKNVFCSKSCAAKYNNAHKSKGNRRSKLEAWLELQMAIIYPDLKIKYNDREIINSELDIYIPSLNLAFELNGIFHYEPIYGADKLASTQNNDNRKFRACLEKKIELVIMDTSHETYFSEKKSKKYLDIIKSIIDNKLCP